MQNYMREISKMSEFKTNWLGEFDSEFFLKVPAFGHDSKYSDKHLPFNISRRGVFQYLENVVQEIDTVEALSIHQASSYLDDINKPIYKLQSNQTHKTKENLILSFYLDDIFQPSFLVKKSLENLSDKVQLKKYKNIYLNIEYGAKSLKGKNIEYIHNFFQQYGRIVKREPLFVKYSDLIKCYDLSSWDYYEGNLIWFHCDSFLKHFCLSRGASVIELLDSSMLYEAIKIEMSPYYSIIFGYFENKVTNEKVEIARSMNHEFFVEHKDVVREENYLLYNFLYTEK